MRLLAILSLLMLAACSAAPVRQAPNELFADASFGPPPAELQQLDLFAMSPAMHAFLDTEMPKHIRKSGAARGLYEAMRTRLRIDYDASTTRTAADTFELRTGNCLSLVILTSTLARELGIPVRYQFVRNERTWSRNGGLVLQNGHVNIALEPGLRSRTGRSFDSGIVIDFLPPQELRRQEVEEIDEAAVIAMYMNNRAAENLMAGDLDAAYWWSRASLQRDPSFVAAYNTLGVIYHRHGLPQLAERSYAQALAMAPDNAELLSNMASLLTATGRAAEAAEYEQRLARVQPVRPFEYLDAGQAALAAGDPATAMRLFKRELARQPYNAEVHYAIAVASARLGRTRDVRRYLEQASTFAINTQEHALYAGKLAKLQMLQVN